MGQLDNLIMSAGKHLLHMANGRLPDCISEEVILLVMVCATIGVCCIVAMNSGVCS
jgi:hypothetical protein